VELFQSDFYGKIQIVPTMKAASTKEITFTHSAANSSAANSTVESTQLQLTFSELKEVS
jgi:segregation and condensation protein A